MNKLTALSKLASAYHTLINTAPRSSTGADQGDNYALYELEYRFNYIRRSLRIKDLKPEPKCTEGYNPKGPTHF